MVESRNCRKISKICRNFRRIFCKIFPKNSQNFENFENLAPEKNVESVDLVKRFPTHIWTQKSASIQRRTDRLKFGTEKWEYNIFYSLLNKEKNEHFFEVHEQLYLLELRVMITG